MKEESYRHVWQSRVSRRRLLQAAAAAGAGIAAGGLFGCGEQKQSAIPPAGGVATTVPPTPTAVGAAPPKKGGSLKMYFPLDVTTLDTHLSISTGDSPFFWLIYDSLVTLSADDNTPLPELAESWEATPDALTYTFKLRKGAKFHDGTDFNADAVKSNFDRIVNPATSSLSATFFTQYVDSYKAVDASTFQLRLKSPYAPLIAGLAGRVGQIMSPKQLDKLGKDYTTAPIGAGPFKLKNRVTQSIFEVERFPDYWDKNKPYVDAINVKIIPDQNVAFTDFLAGNLDGVGVPYDRVDALRKEGKYTVLIGVNSTFGHLLFNCTNGVFKDVRLRKAVSAAINREAILDTTQFGIGKVMKNLVVESDWAYNPNKNFYKYDPATAKRLMAEAGMPNGFKFKSLGFTFTPCPQRHAAIQAQLKEVGIDMDVQNVEIAEGIKQAYAGNYDALHFTYDDPADPHGYFDGNYNTKYVKDANLYNRFPEGPEITKVLDLMAQGVKETDQKKRQALYWQIQDIVNDQMWTASLVQHPASSALNKRVGGARIWADGLTHWRDLYVIQ